MTDPGRFVIWSYEHDAWWKPGGFGYTSTLAEAGRYKRAEADQIVARANRVTVNEAAVPLAEAATFPAAMTRMTHEQIVEGLSLIIVKLANDHEPPAGWTPQQWAYVNGLASAQVLLFRDRIAEGRPGTSRR